MSCDIHNEQTHESHTDHESISDVLSKQNQINTLLRRLQSKNIFMRKVSVVSILRYQPYVLGEGRICTGPTVKYVGFELRVIRPFFVVLVVCRYHFERHAHGGYVLV